jgi:hypothetical protein
VVSLLEEISSQPLAVEFLAPALRGWWKLVCRKADLAFVEAQLILGHDVMACEAAARLVGARPRDPAAADLYRRAAGQLVDRLLGAIRRRLNRARQLAGRGAYPDALAELERLESDTLAPALPVVLGLERGAVVVEALEEASDLRLELQDLQALAAQLGPLQSEIREAGLAAGTRMRCRHARAIFIDPQRNVAAIWSKLDRLIALIAERHVVSAGLVQPPTEPFQQRTAAIEPWRRSADVESHPDGQPGRAAAVWPGAKAEREEMAVLQPPLAVEPTRDLADEGNGAARAGDRVSEVPAGDRASEFVPVFDPDQPQIPFDLEDWLSNVTELSPEDGETENES